jgi:hypothetical protein
VTVQGLIIDRMADGNIVAQGIQKDGVSRRQQLGAMPPLESRGALGIPSPRTADAVLGLTRLAV